MMKTLESLSELQVLGLYGDAFGVDGAEVGVFKEDGEVSLGGFLESGESRGLKANVGVELLSDLFDEALKGEFGDE